MTAERLVLINAHNFPITQQALPDIRGGEVQKGKREEADNPSSLCIYLQGNHEFLRNSSTVPYGTWKMSRPKEIRKSFPRSWLYVVHNEKLASIMNKVKISTSVGKENFSGRAQCQKGD